jgi:hypothetical protein
MKKKRTYGSVDVEKIDPLAIVRLVATMGCIMAVDVAKTRSWQRSQTRRGRSCAS